MFDVIPFITKISIEIFLTILSIYGIILIGFMVYLHVKKIKTHSNKDLQVENIINNTSLISEDVMINLITEQKNKINTQLDQQVETSRHVDYYYRGQKALIKTLLSDIKSLKQKKRNDIR